MLCVQSKFCQQKSKRSCSFRMADKKKRSASYKHNATEEKRSRNTFTCAYILGLSSRKKSQNQISTLKNYICTGCKNSMACKIGPYMLQITDTQVKFHKSNLSQIWGRTTLNPIELKDLLFCDAETDIYSGIFEQWAGKIIFNEIHNIRGIPAHVVECLSRTTLRTLSNDGHVHELEIRAKVSRETNR